MTRLTASCIRGSLASILSLPSFLPISLPLFLVLLIVLVLVVFFVLFLLILLLPWPGPLCPQAWKERSLNMSMSAALLYKVQRL